MKIDMKDFWSIFDYLKHLAVDTGAGKAKVEFDTVDGDVFRIEYIVKKKR